LGEKFDIIISTEVIEHVTSPLDFILDLKKILKSEGQILLTTPRKYNEQDKAIWLTELPPIHLFWFTTKSLNLLGEKAGLEFFEIEVRKDTYISNSITNAHPSLTKKLEPIMKNTKINKIKSEILSYSPTFIKRLYYKLTKRSNIYMYTAKEHHTIFFVYKNMQNTAR
jgi:SAM-dependent methyltransferase